MSLQSRLALLISTIKSAYSGLNVRLTAIESANAEVNGSMQFFYNLDGSVSSITYSDGATKAFSYFANGLTSTIVTTGGGQTVTETFTYLANGDIDTTTTVVS